jgi:hypothetical protein
MLVWPDVFLWKFRKISLQASKKDSVVVYDLIVQGEGVRDNEAGPAFATAKANRECRIHFLRERSGAAHDAVTPTAHAKLRASRQEACRGCFQLKPGAGEVKWSTPKNTGEFYLRKKVSLGNPL